MLPAIVRNAARDQSESLPAIVGIRMETAKQLLAELPAAELPTFFDYALTEARKTNFDVQTLGGIKQYLAGFMVSQKQRAAEKVREAARRKREQEEAQRQAYDSFRRSQAITLFATLPEAERAIIEDQAHAHAAKFTGSLRDSMIEFGRARFTIERHGDKLTTFEQWNAERTVS